MRGGYTAGEMVAGAYPGRTRKGVGWVVVTSRAVRRDHQSDLPHVLIVLLGRWTRVAVSVASPGPVERTSDRLWSGPRLKCMMPARVQFCTAHEFGHTRSVTLLEHAVTNLEKYCCWSWGVFFLDIGWWDVVNEKGKLNDFGVRFFFPFLFLVVSNSLSDKSDGKLMEKFKFQI